MKSNILFLLIGVGIVTSFVHAQSWKNYPYTPSGSRISFPYDEGRHPSTSVEWWYISGHLTGATSGKKYSFMLTYFYYPKSGFDGFRILNIGDDNAGQLYNDTKTLNYDIIATDSLHIEADVFLGGNETWVNKTDASGNMLPFEYEITANAPSHGLDISVISTKKPLILDGDGFFEQGASSSTYYYSFTGNDVNGSLTLNGTTENVTGTAWIDRQYGTFNPYEDEDYEWFHLQLSNGMDINLWNIFTVDNTIPDNKNYRLISVYKDENTQYTNKDFQLERLGFSCLNSGNCYARKWKLTSAVNNLDLTITTLFPEAELSLPFDFYEGATTITGTVNGKAVTGKGFAELLQKYTNPDITFTYPAGSEYNISNPISWNLNNPNDGCPVTYELQYSTDNKDTFTTIADNISENTFLWNNPPLNDGDAVWFRITGKSVDGTLSGITESTTSATVTSSLVDFFSEKNLKVYPIPADEKLIIKFINISDGYDYVIFDQLGRKLTEENNNTNPLNEVPLYNLSSGIYFLRLSNHSAKKTIKIIKK